MSSFGGMVLTNRGRNLQAKAQAGAQLNFTRIGVGDGQLGSSSIVELNALKNQIKSLNISKLKTQTGGKAVVGGILSNQDIVTGFYFREIGVFAQDPDVGEVLYCYANAGATADYIPAGGGADIIEKSIDVIVIVGTASNVSATIDSSLIYASAQELLDHENNDAIHVTSDEKNTWNGKANGADLEALREDVATHKADLVTDADGVHGLKVEEGTWTPLLAGATTAGSHTYSLKQGKYQKVGNKVFFDGIISLSAKDEDMAGGVTIAGLPFLVKNDVARGGITVGFFENLTFPAGAVQFAGNINLNSSIIFLNFLKSGTTKLNVQPADVGATFIITFSGEYLV